MRSTKKDFEIKVSLALLKSRESVFVLIVQRMLIAAVCEIGF